MSTIQSLKNLVAKGNPISLLNKVHGLARALGAAEGQLGAMERKVRDLEQELALVAIELRGTETLLRRSRLTHWQHVLNSEEPHEKAFGYFAEIQDMDVTFLDIGANTGISALSVNKMAPTWPIISIEALKIMEPMLKLTEQHFRSIGVDFSFLITGVGSEKGTETIRIAVIDGEYVDTMASFNDQQFEKSYITEYLDTLGTGKWDGRLESMELEVNRLDDLGLEISSPHVFVKMDVDGFEVEALRGMEQFIGQHSPALMIECEPPQIVPLLAPMGYSEEYYYYADKKLRKGDSVDSQGNYFYFPEGSPLLRLTDE